MDESPQIDDAATVELQSRNRGASYRCFSEHRSSVVTPKEMVVPTMQARVIEWEPVAREWVASHLKDTFEVVAPLTRKREIIEVVRPSRSTGDDMLDRKWIGTNIEWTATILAK